MEKIGEDEPEDEDLFRDLWENESESRTLPVILQS